MGHLRAGNKNSYLIIRDRNFEKIGIGISLDRDSGFSGSQIPEIPVGIPSRSGLY